MLVVEFADGNLVLDIHQPLSLAIGPIPLVLAAVAEARHIVSAVGSTEKGSAASAASASTSSAGGDHELQREPTLL